MLDETRPDRTAAPSRLHWIEYGIEAAALGAFMASAVFFTVLLEHPRSPVHGLVEGAVLRRVLVGLAMGATLVAIVYSGPGRRSGAHLNPVVTCTFLRLGKIAPLDALGYVAAQVAGATAVMLGLAALFPEWVGHQAVAFVTTRPGAAGTAVALLAEATISFGMMTLVLATSNHERWRRYTGLLAGLLVAIYIGAEAPLSGMSMNPARSFGPAVAAGRFEAFWIYLAGPLAGMTAAADVYRRLRGLGAVRCAKVHHDSESPCIFRCGYAAGHGRHPAVIPSAVPPMDRAPAARPDFSEHEEPSCTTT